MVASLDRVTFGMDFFLQGSKEIIYRLNLYAGKVGNT